MTSAVCSQRPSKEAITTMQIGRLTNISVKGQIITVLGFVAIRSLPQLSSAMTCNSSHSTETANKALLTEADSGLDLAGSR